MKIRVLLQFICKHKRPRMPELFFFLISKKSNAGGIIVHDFKLYYRAIVTKRDM
jgi:hypothetical protein